MQVSLKLALNIIDEGLKISKFFPREGFEVKPRDWGDFLVAALVLGPFDANSTT